MCVSPATPTTLYTSSLKSADQVKRVVGVAGLTHTPGGGNVALGITVITTLIAAFASSPHLAYLGLASVSRNASHGRVTLTSGNVTATGLTNSAEHTQG